jgi:hypothetical protein
MPSPQQRHSRSWRLHEGRISRLPRKIVRGLAVLAALGLANGLAEQVHLAIGVRCLFAVRFCGATCA